MSESSRAASTTVARLEPPAMIGLRGPMEAIGPAAAAVTGCPVPQVRAISAQGNARVAWMSPDELLLMPDCTAADALASLAQALQGLHHLALDVSDMRTLFTLRGWLVRETLARLAPADLHPDRFGAGALYRTRLAQIPAAFWLEPDGARVMCFRSVATYAEDILHGAAGDATERFFPQS